MLFSALIIIGDRPRFKRCIYVVLNCMPMDYILTEHAIKRCKRRKIQPEWIKTALSHPARTENDFDDPTLVHALIAIPERGFRILRVIYNESVSPVRIVTIYFDDEASDL